MVGWPIPVSRGSPRPYCFEALLDFDPVDEWLVDVDLSPMSSSDVKVEPQEKSFNASAVIPAESAIEKPDEVPHEKSVDAFGAVPAESALWKPDEVIVDSKIEPCGGVAVADDGFGEKDVKLEAQKNASCASEVGREISCSPIHEKLGKVCLDSEVSASGGALVLVDGTCQNDVKLEPQEDVSDVGVGEVKADEMMDSAKGMVEGESSESSESSESDESSSEESSSSSSGEEDDYESDGEESKGEEMDEEKEMEEGEIIADAVAAWSDDEEGVVSQGPIKSKNEVEDLPPVPRIEVCLEPHHRTLPVGVISSILGDRVIVEGSTKHEPLSEGSILWITEIRSPLGIVDEIFGPVKNPYYVVRFNSDKEVPSGVNEGTGVSFVMEFANHVLNQKDLYKKGYDASGENDEEIMEEVEFSDDEKEAEYRRSLHQSKRSTEHRGQGNRESGGNWKRNSFKDARSKKNLRASIPNDSTARDKSSHGVPSTSQATSSNSSGNDCPYSFGPAQATGNVFPKIPVVPQAVQTGGGLNHPSSQSLQQQIPSVWAPGLLVQQHLPPQQPNVWLPGMLPPQLQNLWVPGFLPQQQLMGLGLPNQKMGNQNYNQHLQNQACNIYPNVLPSQQQFIPNSGNPSGAPWLGGPLNLPVNPMLFGAVNQIGSSPAQVGSNNMNDPGFSGPSNRLTLGQDQSASGWAGMHPLQFNCGRSSPGQDQSAIGQAGMCPPQFNRGRSSARGRKPFGRGSHQSFGRGNRPHNA